MLKVMKSKGYDTATGLARRLQRLLAEHYHGDMQSLAKAMGADVSSVSRYVRGEREPRLHKLQTLAQSLGISTEQLLGRHSPAADAPPLRAALPVFREPPPVSPVLERTGAVGERYLAPSLVRPSRYFIELREFLLPNVLPGDFLLIESDPRAFRPRMRHPDLVVILSPISPAPMLASVAWNPEREQYTRFFTYKVQGRSRSLSDTRRAWLDDHGLGFTYEPVEHEFGSAERIMGQVLRCERDF